MSKLRKPAVATFDEVIADITKLREAGYEVGGAWNLSQVCKHLHETMRVGLDGDEPRAPWLQRKVFGTMLALVLGTGWMPSGVGTIPRLVPDDDEDSDEAIDRCLATLAEARDRTEPLPPYPMCDGMTLDKWKRLMVIHSRHHLGFLAPKA